MSRDIPVSAMSPNRTTRSTRASTPKSLSEGDPEVADAGVPVAAGPLDRPRPARTARTASAAPRTAPAARAAPGWRRGSSARPGRSPGAGWASGDVEDIGVGRRPSSSRFAEPSQTRTFCPAAMAWPPSRRSRVAVRRFDGDGDRPAQHLLDRRGQQRRDRHAARRSWSGCSISASRPPRDGVAGGLGPGREQQAEEQVQLEVGQRRRVGVVERRVRDDREHVVGRARPLRRDQLLAVLVHPRPGVLRRHRRSTPARPAEVELRLDGLEQPMPFGLRHSQQNADHLHRQLGGDVDEEVERLAAVARRRAARRAATADRPRRARSSAA